MASYLQPGRAIFAILKIGSVGPPVTLLHSYLLLLRTVTRSGKDGLDGYLPPSELAMATFGPGTRIAVLKFQEEHDNLLAGQPSGTVDQETAAVLYAQLVSSNVDLNHPRILFVAGSVHYADGSTSSELSVAISDRDLNREKLIASPRVRADGFLAVQYCCENYLRGDSGRRPNLVPRVLLHKTVLYTPSVDEVIYDAPILALINITLDQKAPSAPTSDEFTQVVTALDQVLPPAEKQTTPKDGVKITLDSSIGDRIRPLHEDAQVQDISYLTRVKPAILTTTNLSQTILAYRIAQVATEQKINISAEVFYALLATNTNQHLASQDPSNLGLADVTLETPPDSLLYQFGLLDVSLISQAVSDALSQDLVSSKVNDIDLSAAWTKLRPISDKWIIARPTAEDNLWTMIADFLQSGKEEAVRQVLNGDNIEGDWSGFLVTLQEAFIATKTATATQAITEERQRPTSVAVAEKLKAAHSKSSRDLAAMDQSSLEGLVASTAMGNGDEKLSPEESTAATEDLARELEKEFPTAAFTSKLRRYIDNSRKSISTVVSATGENSKPEDRPKAVTLGHESLAIDAHAIASFLQENSEFDMQTSKIELAKSTPASDSGEARSIAMVQRVFKLAPTFDKTKALLDIGVHSATHISSMSRAHFLQIASNSSSFTTAEAAETFDRAANIRLATSLLAGNLHSAANAMLPAGISEPLPPAKLEDLTKNFPNIATLFEIGDVCACSDCMTVYSPSAYLVDVLEFLSWRGVLDSVGGPNNGQMARDVLFKRRPDLADLDLSCNNTNVTLPYIDLVCELLEDFVAPDGLSPGSFSGTVTKGKISTTLLGFLRDDLNLPFTEDALVSDTYNGGYRTVRDQSAVVSLSPGTQSVRVLRQTYGDAATLAASPAYLNAVAYDRVSKSTYLPSLPFNATLQECRAYLSQLGVPRDELMRKIAQPALAYNISLEELNLSFDEGSLITSSDENNQDQYWNTGNPTNPETVLKNIQTFITTTRIEYTDLQTLLAATGWLNPPAMPPTNSSVTLVGAMYVRHLDSTCTLNAKEIETLDSPALDRMHRFIRLWKALTGDAQSGWTISSLDRVIASPVLGAMKLNTDCVSTVTAVARAAKLLSSQITTTLEDVIDLFAMLRILPPSDALTQFGTTYTSLFLNATAHGPVDPLFELRTIGLNDSTTPPAAPPKLSDSVDYIARCLGIGSSDATNIIQSIATQPANSILTIANLSKVYAVVSLSRRLGLSVSDYFLFTQLSSLTPLQDLGHLESFTEVVAKLQAQNLSAPNIQFITQPPTTPPSSADITTTQIIEILINLQGQYFTIQGANQSPYDATLTATENETAALSLISQIQGVSQTDLSLFRQMLDSGLNASDGEALINNKLASIGTVACATIATAQSQFAASPGDTSLQNMLVQVVADTLSAYFAQLQRETALEGVLSDAFNFDTDVTAALLQGVPSLQSLLDEKLAAGTITDTNFPQQFQAILLIFRLSFLLPNFGLSTTNLSWLLQNAGSLGWATLSSLPTLSTRPPISWDSWLALIDYIAVVNAAEFPDVQNSADKNSPFTLNGFLSLVLATEPQGPDPTPLVPYFCSLTANDPTIISALVTSFGYKNPSFKRADTLRKLDSAANIIRKLNMPPANAIFLAEAQTPSLDDTAAARNALKLRYLVNSDWLDVLKTIQDPLRLQKRDALIDYLLAYNKPNLTSATDLSEILLIDVEMSTETLTSRIIQAHQSVQQFAQRLLMGLEPTPLVDDPTWSHWAEMSQYRLWEANKKVFLYPETWIEPELRDNKSELYVQLEEELKKQPITTTTSELAVAGYLSGLDSIAELEVMSCFYDVPSSTLHVFARTKGGNPRVYYHRTLVLEAVWSPWEKLDGVEITGNHLLSFLRSNRLTVMWPVFTYEQNPNQVNQPPPYPDPNNLTNSDGSQKSADPIEQRLKVQLAVSEQNPDTGKWSARVVGEDGVYWPQNNSYSPATDFSDSLEDSIGLFYWDFGGNLGQAIMVCENVSTQVGRIAVNVFGAFNMTGCKGYPVPFSSTKRELAYYFYTLPAFRNTDYVTERFVKSQDLATNSPSDLAIMTVLSGSEYDILLGKEYGQFVVTYPTQPTIIDRAFVAWEMYALGLSASGSKTTEMMVSEGYRRLIVPQGIFLPYFVSDSSTREYVITPGYESSNTDDTNFRTASATLNFFNRVVVLVLKYIDVYFNKINKNITELRKLVNEDDEYKTLKKELLSVYVDATNIRGPKLRQLKVDMASFYHPLVCFLRSQLYSSGLPGLLARTTQLQVTNFDFNTVYQPTAIVRQPYPREELDFSLSGPYAGYNWELFFHLPFQIASSLSDDQQFDKAQDWYHYIFNPEGADLEDPDTGPDRATAPQKKYWQTQPFFRTQVKDYISERIDSILGAVAADPNGFSLANDLKTQVRLWRTNPYSPHVIARTRPVAYQMCIFMKYVQNLLGWGDNLFAQLTRETITQASTLYMVADKLLGSKPQTVQPAVPVPVRTYNELGSSIDILGNALLGIENLIPDLGSLPHGGKELPQPPAPPLTSLYFGIPPNDNMLQLWDLVADRLYKIRHSQDINGNFIQLALTSPPIDPGALIKALASGASLSDIIGGLNAPLPHYRFGYVLERAQALVQHVVELGQQLLAVLEKRDAEGLARLRAQSELTVLASVRGVKLAAIAQNALAIKALQAGKAVAQERQAYYAGLLTVPINPEEQLSLSKNADAIVVDGVMALGHVAAAEANLVPSFSVGVEGFGGSPSATVSFGGSNVAGSISSLMAAAASARSILATEAGLYSTKASYTRRTAEWQFQMALAQGDMAHIDAEIAAANGTGATLQAELVAHDTTATESASAAAYLKNKFTNTELYDWAVRRVSGVYYQAFQLAFSMAKKAERCMAFELGDFSASSAFIQYGYWDNLRSGLLAGGDLQLALDRLGTAYIDRHMRELELTKSISLAQLDPTALLNLRTAGTCMFSLPETLFDLDFPGHYFRRTKNIALSIPCVVGPYTSVSATLRLLSSRYRAATANATASGYPEAAGGNDPRFIYNVVPPPTMAATSSAVNDAGVFELRSDDPRYLPFEHAGVLGTYSLSLSPTQQFPYAAVADAILTISYTARDGGSALQGAAKTAPTAGVAAIGLRTAFPVEWNALKAGRAVEPILAGAAQLPYWATAQGRGVDVGVTVWCAVPASGQDLDGVVLVVAGQALALTKDSDGVFWKATLPAKAVVFGKSVSVAWKVADDRAKVDEIICVVDFGVKSS